MSHLRAPQSFFMNESGSPSMHRSGLLASGFAATTLAPSDRAAKLISRRTGGRMEGLASVDGFGASEAAKGTPAGCKAAEAGPPASAFAWELVEGVLLAAAGGGSSLVGAETAGVSMGAAAAG